MQQNARQRRGVKAAQGNARSTTRRKARQGRPEQGRAEQGVKQSQEAQGKAG